MKRKVMLIVGIIAVMIAMLLCCGSAMAASGGTYDGISWHLSDDGVLTLGNGGTQTMALNNNRDSSSWPWTSLKTSIKSVKCNGQVIAKGSLVGMFSGCSNLVSVDTGNFDTSAVTKMSALFNGCSSLVSLDLSQWDVSQITDMNSMFSSCGSLETVNVSGWNTSSARDMEYMFYRCNKLTTLDVSSWNVSRVYDMGYMFYDCFVLNSLDVSEWYTNALQYMSDMFYRCRKLQRLDMKNFNTSNVRNMDRVFLECSGLTYLDVSHFNTSSVTSMQMMFFGCNQLENIDVSNWNVSNVTRFSGSYGMAEAGFFEGCGSLKYLDLSNWNTRRCTDANNFNCFFNRCYHLTRIALGERFVFPARSCLPTPSYHLNGVFYTGKWVHEDGVAGPYTPIELMEAYDASMAGTWIWEEGEVVYTVKFESSEPDVTTGSMANRYLVPTVANPLYWPSFSAYKRTFDHWEDDRGNYYARGSSIPAGRFEIGDVVTMTAYWTHPDWLVTMENGEFDISLVGGETAVFENIPANTSYAVYEETPRGWVLVGTVNTSGIIQTLDRSEARFVNQYDPEKASIHLAVQKLLDGKPAEVDSFYFGLQSEDGTLMQIKGVSDSGLVLFDPIEFTEDDAGMHVFSIYELGSDDNIIYDTHVQDITVDVQYIENVMVYSHSDNLDDNGIKQSDYVSNQYYTDIVTIPGAESLHVKIVYTNPRGQFYVWKGAHEGAYTQTYSSDFNTNTTYKSYYYQSGRDQEYLTDEFDIDGDSLTVLYSSYAFQPGTSSYSDMVNYGYYMTVSNNNNGFSVDVNYDQDGMVFENVSKPGKLVLTKTSTTSHSSDDTFIYEVQFMTENGQSYELLDSEITYENHIGGIVDIPELQPLPEKPKYKLTVQHGCMNGDRLRILETVYDTYAGGDIVTIQGNEYPPNGYQKYRLSHVDSNFVQAGDNVWKGVMQNHDLTVTAVYDLYMDYKITVNWSGDFDPPNVTAILYSGTDIVDVIDDIHPGEDYYVRNIPCKSNSYSTYLYYADIVKIDGYMITRVNNGWDYATYSMAPGFNGEIIWDDFDNAYGLRPNRIGVACDQKGTSSSNSSVGPSWDYFNKYVYGFHYLYDPEIYPVTIRVQNTSLTPFPAGYEEIHYDQDDSIGKYDIKMKLVSIPTAGTIVWDDNDNSAGKRPASVVVHIMDGTLDIDQMVVDDANDWAFVLNYPVPLNGAPLNYTIRVEDVDGYTASIDGTTVTMMHIPTVDITVTDVTLLSASEYNTYRSQISSVSTYWWLREPGSWWSSTQYVPSNVMPNGSIEIFYASNANWSIRPVLVCDLNGTGLEIGNKLRFAGYDWTVISDSLVLCDSCVGNSPFGPGNTWVKSQSETLTTPYDDSYAKTWVENWAVEKGIMPEPEFEITDVTLLSKNEYDTYRDEIAFDMAQWWWLRSPGSSSKYANFVRNDTGSVGNYAHSVSTDYFGVRPALICDLDDVGYSVGDKVSGSGYEWTVISDLISVTDDPYNGHGLILCDEIVGQTAFRTDDTASDANVYDVSDVKQWLANWIATHPFWTKTVTATVIQ